MTVSQRRAVTPDQIVFKYMTEDVRSTIGGHVRRHGGGEAWVKPGDTRLEKIVPKHAFAMGCAVGDDAVRRNL
jgi:hypothetical protein